LTAAAVKMEVEVVEVDGEGSLSMFGADRSRRRCLTHPRSTWAACALCTSAIDSGSPPTASGGGAGSARRAEEEEGRSGCAGSRGERRGKGA
jgi:hypothetical protein